MHDKIKKHPCPIRCHPRPWFYITIFEEVAVMFDWDVRVINYHGRREMVIDSLPELDGCIKLNIKEVCVKRRGKGGGGAYQRRLKRHISRHPSQLSISKRIKGLRKGQLRTFAYRIEYTINDPYIHSLRDYSLNCYIRKK